MKLVNAKTMAMDAARGGYAVPALNTNGATYDITRAIIEAADEMRSPLIIQCYEPNLEYRGYDYFPYLVKHLAEGCTIPIALHLDHGHGVDSIMKAVRAGFTSVMIDCASLPLTENIRQTRRVAELVGPLGISVEGEVGNIIKSSDEEGKKAPLTDAADVRVFAKESSADLLAVAVGTTHGIFKEQTGIDLGLISELRNATDIPLVLHGTCGVPLGLISECVKNGMAKINFGEALRMNYIKYFNEFSETLDHEHHAWRIMRECKDRLKADIKLIIEAVSSAGRAA